MKFFTALVFGLFLVFPLNASFAQEHLPLKAAELHALLIGNSMAGNGKANEPAEPFDWIAYYAADGKMSMRLKPEWGGATDIGQWWITKSNELCRKFTKMGSGKIGCWLFYREGEFYRFIPSQGSAVEGLATVIQGNLLTPPN